MRQAQECIRAWPNDHANTQACLERQAWPRSTLVGSRKPTVNQSSGLWRESDPRSQAFCHPGFRPGFLGTRIHVAVRIEPFPSLGGRVPWLLGVTVGTTTSTRTSIHEHFVLCAHAGAGLIHYGL